MKQTNVFILILSIIISTAFTYAGTGEAISSSGSLSSVKSLIITSPAGGEYWKTGSTQSVAWTADNIMNLQIDYSVDNGVNWVSPSVSSSVSALTGTFSWASIPNTAATSYKIRLSEVGGTTTQTSSSFSVFQYITSFSSSKSITFNDAAKETSFRMVGLPGDINVSVSQVLNGSQKTDWNVYRDNGVISSNKNDYFIEYDGSSNFNFKPGIGFWVISKNGLNYSGQPNTLPIADDNSYSIPLHSGWNIISNPFDKSCNWSKVIAANGLTTNSVLYSWSGQWVYPTNLVLPYNGYYFNNTTSLTSLKMIYDPAGSASRAEKVAGNSLFSSSDLLLSLSNNNSELSKIGIGIDKSSSSDYDITDYFAPPGNFEEAGMRIINEKLSTNYKQLFIEHRREVGDGQEFSVQIVNKSPEALTLNASGLSNFPNDNVYLVDKKLFKFYNLKENNKLTIGSTRKLNDFSVLIGNAKFIETVKASLLPVEYALLQNYPNPFNPSTVITYEVPENSRVTLKVFDVLGKEVQQLVNQEQSAGRYEVEFGSKSMSTGVYFYTLTTGKFTSTKKMLMVK